MIGALALVLLLAPWALRQWQEDHLTAGKVMVLWEGGAVKAIDASAFLKYGLDVSPITQSGGESPAKFWKIAP